MFLQKGLLARGAARKCSTRSLSASSKLFCIPATEKNDSFAYYRTKEQDPSKHNLSHVGRLFTIPTKTVDVLGPESNLFPQCFEERSKILGEHTMLVRKPALEVIGYLKQLDWQNQKAPKFLFWGQPGCGKSMSLAQIAHFCHDQGYIILNFRKIQDWFLRHQEVAQSEWKEARVDHIVDSQDFLKEFLVANESKIQHLKCHKTYSWSHREKTEEASPLVDIITKGLDRPKFAADCLNVLMKELKLHCQDGTPNCRVVILIDGVNVIFEPKSYVSKTWSKGKLGPFSQEYIDSSAEPNELSVIYNLKKMLVSDFNNAAIIATVDRKDKLKFGQPYYHMWWKYLEHKMVPNLESDYPFDLLSQEGWELFDPFVPVEVPAFSQGELDVMIDYCVDMKYIRAIAATEAGRQEIRFLTGKNPQNFFDYSNYW